MTDIELIQRIGELLSDKVKIRVKEIDSDFLENGCILKDSYIQKINLYIDETKITGLEEIVFCIKQLCQLKSLAIAGIEKIDLSVLSNITQINTLCLPGCRISDYSFLKSLSNLSELELSDNNLKDLACLKYLSNNIKKLYLGFNEFDNISILEHHSFSKLEYLDLSFNDKLSDCSPLKTLKRLVSLDLSYSKIDKENLFVINSLSGLRELNISNNNLDDLSCIQNLDKLKVINSENNNISSLDCLQNKFHLEKINFSQNQISDIQGITHIESLLNLDLSENKISDISPIRELVQIKYLNISSNKISSISSLEKLNKLEDFSANNNQIKNTNVISRLKRIKRLDLSNNQISDISSICNLINLIKLELENCNLSDILPLQSLINLKSLNLTNNKITTTLSLRGLIKLKTLDLSKNNLSTISGLKDLSELAKLSLSHNELVDISVLNSLNKLSFLDVSYNRKINIDTIRLNSKKLDSLRIDGCNLKSLDFIKNIKGLTYLTINDNQISEIRDLSLLKKLIHISANKNYISDISPLSGLKKVRFLKLLDNQISNIDILEEFDGLRSIDVRNNKIENLPEFLTKYDSIYWELDSESYRKIFWGIAIGGNPIKNIPIEIIKQGKDAIIRFFERKEKENFSAIHEAKLILVGDGAAGKTTLQKRLLDPQFPLHSEEERTRGIDICNWEFRKNYIAHIWDFGGQDVYYPVHRFFLTENSVFVLLASTRKEQHNFDYWIPTIFQFGGCSPIIIGQTCHDGNTITWNDLGIYISNPDFNIIKAQGLPYFELNIPRNNKGLAAIKNEIIHQLVTLPHCNRDIPNSWIATRDALEEEAKQKPCISFDRLKEICDTVAPDVFISTVDYIDCAHFLHNIGVILWYSDNTVLRDWVILRPDWAMQAVYKIIDDDKIQSRRGHILAADLKRLWNDYLYEHKHSILKQMLEVFRVAFPKKHKNEEYIIPARLLSMPDEKRWHNEPCLLLEYEYPFMPRGILNQVSAELSKYIKLDEKDIEEVWNNAVNFEVNDSLCQVEEIFYEKKIKIRTKGKDSRGLAMVVMDALDNITRSYKGVIPKIYVPCTCHKCNEGEYHSRFLYDDLLRYSKVARKDVYCNESGDMLNIDDLLYNTGFLQKIDINTKTGTIMPHVIKIFLASSSELNVDRKEFELFINRMNKKLVLDGIFLNLEIWEDFLDAVSKTRLQDEYNEAVKDSDIFISLFFSKAGRFTEEEFDTAYGQFIKIGKPYVYTYFKDANIKTGDITDEIHSLLKFKQKLKDKGHFPTNYTSTEDLNLQFENQLQKLLPRLKKTKS